MQDRIRAEYVKSINEAKLKLQTAGKIHRKDLSRQIGRMEKELRMYDKFHKVAACRG